MSAAPTGGTARCATIRCASIDSAGDGPTTLSLSRSRMARSTGVPRQIVVVRLAASSPEGSSPISATPKLVTTVPRVRLTVAVAVPSSPAIVSEAVPDAVSETVSDAVSVTAWVDGVEGESLTVRVADAGATASPVVSASDPLSSEIASMASSIDPITGAAAAFALALLLSVPLAVMVARRSTGPPRVLLFVSLVAPLLVPGPVVRCAKAGIETSNATPTVRLASVERRCGCCLFRKIFIRDDLVHDDGRRRDLPCRQRDQTGSHKAGHHHQNNTNSIHVRSAIRPGQQGILMPPP